MYPAAPWRLVGQGWLSLLRVRGAGVRPDGMYVAAFVSYEPESPLTYSELLIARLLPGSTGREVEVTDIWVDSVASLEGGRELWAIPKQLCDFTLEATHTGPLSRTSWSATAERRPIADASFTDVAGAAVRLPFTGLKTRQPGLDGGPERSAPLRGSARALPCRGRWDFPDTGPLAWLRGQRRLASFRMADFRMTFG